MHFGAIYIFPYKNAATAIICNSVNEKVSFVRFVALLSVSNSIRNWKGEKCISYECGVFLLIFKWLGIYTKD